MLTFLTGHQDIFQMYQYQLLLLLTWHEIVASLKISSFFLTNTAGKCPDFSSEISGLVAKNTAGKRPNVSFKILVSVDIFNKTSGHLPDILITILLQHPVNNINLWSHKHSWKMSWSLIRNIWFSCQKHPHVLLKMSYFVDNYKAVKRYKYHFMLPSIWLENVWMSRSKY